MEILRKNKYILFAAALLFAGTPLLMGCDSVEPEEQDVYAAEFSSILNPDLVPAGFQAVGRIITQGDLLQVEIATDEAPAGIMHLQHIHAAAECPAPTAAGEDGILTLQEGLPSYGPVLIPLDTQLADLDEENPTFPTANAEGEYGYVATVNINTLMEALEVDDLDLEGRTIVIHGVDPEHPDLPEGMNAASIPIACSTIVQIN